MNNTNIGLEIKKNRVEKKITQKELALLIGKSERMVQKYESNTVTPSMEMLTKIASVLEIDTYKLLGFSDEMINQLNQTETEAIKSAYTERLPEIFELFINSLIISNYGHEKDLTTEQLNNLMKIASNTLLPALELIINN